MKRYPAVDETVEFSFSHFYDTVMLIVVLEIITGIHFVWQAPLSNRKNEQSIDICTYCYPKRHKIRR